MPLRRWIIAGSILFFITLLSWQIYQLNKWWYQPNTNPVTIVNIQPGSSITQIIQQLKRSGVITQEKTFRWNLRFRHPQQQLQAGEYLFAAGITPAEIFQQLKAGKVLQHPVTLVEGWTFAQVLAELAKQTSLQHNLQGLDDAQIMQRLQLDNPPEGWFYPNTYFYVRDSSEQAILIKAHQMMQKQLALAWGGRASNLPYKTPYDALIAASILEKESALTSERPLVASVIVNRLNKGMPLQMDPTVIYGMGSNYQGDIHTKDLKADTPYNTYVHAGLPPTPICMPSLDSIQAVLHPATTNYLYFVAKGDGSHQFSSSLAQHDKAVRAYLKSLKQAKNAPKPQNLIDNLN